jgi:RimJ/RimL family protein N-acetyltransferase
VVQIEDIEVFDQGGAGADYRRYETWISAEDVGIVSCRLAHDRLRDSMFLEARGFRFVEMVLHPRLDALQSRQLPRDDLLIAPAAEADLRALQGIAERAFGFERYHVDPRLSPRQSDQRYGRWVRNSLHHPSQQLLKILDGDQLIALFLIEMRSDQSAYWHLAAIAPQWQGQGYGRRVWLAMLNDHKSKGCQSVSTTISARNTPMLNLYSQLQFRFTPPEMTFHWIRDCK